MSTNNKGYYIGDKYSAMRLENKKIQFQKEDDKVVIRFNIFDEENAEKPACSHKVIKGKVRQTDLCLSIEAMDALVFLWRKSRNNN